MSVILEKNGDWLKRSEERAETCLSPLFRMNLPFVISAACSLEEAR